MGKRQKIAMKKLQFVTVNTVGSNCQGVIIQGQYNRDPRGNCPGEIVLEPM